LARQVHPSRAAAVVKIGWYGEVELVAHDGPAFDVPLQRVARLLGADAVATRACDDAQGAPGPLLRPLTDGVERWALALEPDPCRAPPREGEPDPLAVLVSAIDAALARSRSGAALRQAAARDAALLDALREGVLRVDREGVIEALNHAAAALLGVCREEALGRRLRDFPMLTGLRCALAAAAGPFTEFVQLRVRDGEVVVRAQPYEGGAVVTLLEASADGAAAQRTVGSVPRYRFEDLIGRAPAFLRVLEEARRAARSDVPVLIRGESGTGKEMLAQAMHNASPRAGAPFLGVNVTAIPRELLESELFGYEGGAFTGARASGRAGKFELAGRGTLLLDEIGDMAPEMQAKLLRVLQERVVQRLGGARDIPVRARVVATTHRDLAEGVATGRFRLDLLHRLRVVELTLPSLREHREDIPLLVEHQLRAHARATGRSVAVAPALLAALQAHDWPGNVRELRNVLEAELSLLAPGQDVLERIPAALGAPKPAPAPAPEPEAVLSLEDLERRACAQALAAFRGNVARAAEALGVAKNTLYAKIKRYGLAGAAQAVAAVAGQAC
ncbi:MAG TPA: sigma 54-interacting transcriptional regulator, partial [Anaeromyxobacteraceae bacterium]|nr:sigma 54-interacting transcriptional regulator [Anaeromyxobacteraceae bacterium]